MKADALNARNLFDGNVHYEIPVFQRPYVWDEENQWAPLWGDIVRVAEKVVAAAWDADALAEVGGHFLGAIVYESKPPVVGDVTRHLVIAASSEQQPYRSSSTRSSRLSPSADMS